MPSLEFRDNLADRIQAVVRDIRDGCLDCGDGLCKEHLNVVQDLTLNPREMLPKLEAEYMAQK